MNTLYPPIDSEFAIADDVAIYDHWFREQVQTVIDDPLPATHPNEVMDEMRTLIASKQKTQKANNGA
ncbi:MAG: hypothetical protein ABW202_10160 [Duganella sp.]